MAISKPTKPTNLMPRHFADDGIKNNFTTAKIASGFSANFDDILQGDNLNYVLDSIGKELEYLSTVIDFINELPVGKVITTNNNNQLDYSNRTDIPTMVGQNGKFLSTDGTQTVWTDVNTDFIQLPSIGTINLTTNSINYIEPTGNITFVLPNVSADTKLNQILVQVYLSTVYSINVGTTHYFNGKTPNMSTTGMYNLIFEYDESRNYWICGWLRKS